MEIPVIIKYIGLTTEASALIESRRSRPDQAEWEIIVEALDPKTKPLKEIFDLGQGVELNSGERLYLFLNEQSKKARAPDGIAEVRTDGIYVEGRKIEPSRGSPLQPAMRFFQERAKHRVSLSSWRQWHVQRENRLVPLVELKDPALARRRGQTIDTDALLAQLDGPTSSLATNSSS
jgi:hypothetical protein